MKKDIHPPYQEILFVDSSTGYKFVCGSALQPQGKETFEGKEYPVYYVSVSSASHPFFTGSKGLIDAEGRVDKFMKRYAKKTTSVEEKEEKKESSEEEKKDAKAKQKKKK